MWKGTLVKEKPPGSPIQSREDVSVEIHICPAVFRVLTDPSLRIGRNREMAQVLHHIDMNAT
jgi:hypothetical protein